VGAGYSFGGNPMLDDFFELFFGERPGSPRMPERHYKQRSLGSGFIVSADGHVVTNNHVVEDADEITVKLSDEREFKAKVIGRDAKTDLAVIKLEKASNLTPVQWGSSGNMEVGDWVVAVGSPFGLQQTVSHGIISAKGRVIGAGPYDDFLQTDAPINPGNSGGPLANLDGQVIGVNTAITSRSGGSEGIGFAIPSDLAVGIYDQLVKKGKVTRGWLGVQIQELDDDLREYFQLPKDRDGVVISSVMDDGPADQAGFKSGDVLIDFDGKPVVAVRDLQRVVAETGVGRKVKARVWREKAVKTLSVTLGDMDEASGSPVEEVKARSSIGLKVRGLRPDELAHYGLDKRLGVVVEEVEAGSPAEEASLRKGDLITEVDHEAIHGTQTFSQVVKSLKKGKTYILKVKRGKGSHYVRLRPAD
jgi:serine protease Do